MKKIANVVGLKGVVAAVVLLFVIGVQLVTPNASKAESSYNYCAAYTYCPNSGMTISCNVSGNASTWTACNWSVVPGYSVSCNGFNGYGMWESFYFTCY